MNKHRNGTNAYRQLSVKIIGICQNTYHALVTLSSNHIFSALALPSLLIADLRYRAISVALTGCRRGERGERRDIISYINYYFLMAEFLHEYM